MRFLFFGLSITSSWGNGHATTYRALLAALAARGHSIRFYERDVEWYRENRDLPHPSFCELHIYDSWLDIAAEVRRELRACDVAIIGSYFPDARAAAAELFASNTISAFYDIDTPITVAALRTAGETTYLRAQDVPRFNIYFSFTGGPMLADLRDTFGARLAAPLYCSFDPAVYRPRPRSRRYACDLSYMGTYAPDRQPKLEEFLCRPAQQLAGCRFLIAGPQYPKTMRWPPNVRRIVHLNPRWHPLFYSSARITLNVTRRDMVHAGWSPSVRLFEAAACGATIASDNWPGLDSFLTPGREVLLLTESADMVRYLTQTDDAELSRVGDAARERVWAEHSSARRAIELEQWIERARSQPAAQMQQSAAL